MSSVLDQQLASTVDGLFNPNSLSTFPPPPQIRYPEELPLPLTQAEFNDLGGSLSLPEPASPLISLSQGPSITVRDRGKGFYTEHEYLVIVGWRSVEEMYASRSDVDMVFGAVLSQLQAGEADEGRREGMAGMKCDGSVFVGVKEWERTRGKCEIM